MLLKKIVLLRATCVSPSGASGYLHAPLGLDSVLASMTENLRTDFIDCLSWHFRRLVLTALHGSCILNKAAARLSACVL